MVGLGWYGRTCSGNGDGRSGGGGRWPGLDYYNCEFPYGLGSRVT